MALMLSCVMLDLELLAGLDFGGQVHERTFYSLVAWVFDTVESPHCTRNLLNSRSPSSSYA